MFGSVVYFMAWFIFVLISIGLICKIFIPLQIKRQPETVQQRVISLIVLAFEFIIVYQFLFGVVK